MRQIKIYQLNLVFIAGLLALNNPVYALQVEPGAAAGLEYTNNAALTPNHEDDDWIATSSLGVRINQSDGPITSNTNASLAYENYINNTYGNKYYFNLNSTNVWEMIRNRFDWNIEDFYSQTPVDSINADTPANIQNTNVFSLGPNIYFPISGRQKLTLSPLYQNYSYGDTDTDNQQYGMDANWLYQLYPTTRVGIDGGMTKVKYANSDKNPDYTIDTVNGIISVTRARSEYTLNAGGTYIRRDVLDNASGLTGNLTWLYKLTGHSSARLYLASELTDTSAGYYDSQVNPDNGSYSNEQASSDVLRNNVGRLTLERQSSTLSARVWGEYRDLDYKVAPDDRKVQEFGTALDYHISPLLTTGLYGEYNRTKQTSDSRLDKQYAIGGNVGYRLTRKLQTVFGLHYRNEDSTLASAEYSEFGAFIRLVYGLGYLSPVSSGFLNY